LSILVIKVVQISDFFGYGAAEKRKIKCFDRPFLIEHKFVIEYVE